MGEDRDSCEKIFNVICKKCAEKDESCCNFKLTLTRKEIDLIKKFKKDLKYKQNGSVYNLIRDSKEGRHRCQFLTSEGCCLPADLKSLDCVIFPLNIIYHEGVVEFYLSKYCMFYKDIPSSWIEETKKLALERFNSWSEDEKKEYSKVAEGISKEILIRV